MRDGWRWGVGTLSPCFDKTPKSIIDPSFRDFDVLNIDLRLTA